ncbi:hypothetical protein [Pedobacter sp. L105]|uniref:hypothetical protein n=1 Tax=Pedobacter sp. L105 TaxID=1641871 RepID=UPI00131C363F|nr:hypothetical protein [Pedobacter sp. L105]
MSVYSLKKVETIHALTIDIVDEENVIQQNDQTRQFLNLTWVWDGTRDKADEKRKVIDEIQIDLAYVQETFGAELANQVLTLIYRKIDMVYSLLFNLKRSNMATA